MRLSDVVNDARRKVSELTNWVKHPVARATQLVQQRAQTAYESAEFFGKKKEQGKLELTATAATAYASAGNITTHPANNTASEIINLNETPAQNGSTTQLLEKTELKSQWGERYTIGQCLLFDPKVVRCEATNRSGETFWVQEYVLSEEVLSAKQIQERKRSLDQLIRLNTRTTHGPDFRIVRLVEAIVPADEPRCYLVTKPIPGGTTLADYLSQLGALPTEQIREVLVQVLQTLWFLHSQQVYFSVDDSDPVLPHGNLSLHSLWIREMPAAPGIRKLPFFIYVSDLKLWEHLFPGSPAFSSRIARNSKDLGTVGSDLRSLGAVAFQVAGGKLPILESGETAQLTAKFLQADPVWQSLDDAPLKALIQQLLQTEESETSPTRTETLLREAKFLPPPDRVALEPIAATQEVPEPESAPVRQEKWVVPALILLSMGVLGLIVGVLWSGRSPQVAQSPDDSSTILASPSATVPASFSQIRDIPIVPTEINYLVEKNGDWFQGLEQAPTLNTTQPLREILGSRTPKGDLALNRLSISPTSDAALMKILSDGYRSRKIDAGLLRLSPDLQADLVGWETQPVAYGALVVFVPASDTPSLQALVNQIGETINLKDLQDLFTGKTKTINGKEVKLYFPQDDLQSNGLMDATSRSFETLVLQDDPNLIAEFRRLRQDRLSQDATTMIQATQKDGRRRRSDIYARMLDNVSADTQEDVIRIGFDRMDRMFGQCSVYPLRVAAGEKAAVSPLLQSNGQPITPNTDLCNEKGSYFPNISQSSPYPLQYTLGVVFPKGSQTGQILAEILRSDEAQYLLSQVGLMPAEPIQALWRRVPGDVQP